ncbi:receptor-like protein 12 isoform X2 [Populus alba x Populus x berolinensis]|nr:receptor-like protein 12 isoform X2 [Populus alba x Populus x berolinensis]
MPSSPYRFSCYPPKKVLWKEGTDCCSWDGVTCNMQTGHVIGLDLGCCMLYGALHSNSTLFSLHHLQKLDLSRNDFNRSVISSSFGQFLHLTHLNLYSSNFAGQVPPEISHLSRLVSLDLSSNSEELMLEPISFNKLAHNLTQLRELYLGGVNMSLVVPSSLMNLSSSLSSLQLWRCGLKGELPDLLGNLTQLIELGLAGNNQLGGQIPFSLGKLKQLKYLHLGNNSFIGPIPDSLFKLTQLEWLDLSYNRLTGLIPFQISRLSSLTALLLSNNQLIGRIPSQISRLSGLIILDISHNLLSGTIPSSLFSMPSLHFLLLNNNLLYGQISPFLCNSLQYINLSFNKLYGQIPPSVFKLEHLRLLRLSSNDKLTELKFLEILDLSNNGFSGFIPQCLGNFSGGLLVLHLGQPISGAIPSSIINCVNLEFLDLGNNMIDDTFPSFLETLPKLKVVILRSNKLHGSLKGPTVKDSFSKLQILDLSNCCYPIFDPCF